MLRRAAPVLSALVLAACVAACGGASVAACGGASNASVFDQPQGESDTGSGSGDASGDDSGGTPVEDGTAPVDSSTPSVDSGTVATDSGTPSVDSGTVVIDSGTVVIDSGTVVIDSGTVPDLGVDTGVPCTEPNSKTYLGHCYFPIGPRAWNNARDACVAAGAHLATVTSSGEMAVVGTVGTGERWIGLARFGGASTFTWLTGEPVSFTYWNAGEPNGSGACARMLAGGRWADYSCSTSFTAICERE
ncbi:MAG: C-type lectin domain-containing protein [Deltaproteobacteria bacterium]|nr:C-type lectin domain-containing protein [Deltaproteobacteria bacterium]